MFILTCCIVVQENFSEQNRVGPGAAGWEHGSVPTDIPITRLGNISPLVREGLPS